MTTFLAFDGEFILTLGSCVVLAIVWSISLFLIRRDVGRTAQGVQRIAESLAAISRQLDTAGDE